MSSIFICLYLDEDVNVLVADLLQARGFDVITARDAGQLRATDAEQLAYAVSQARTTEVLQPKDSNQRRQIPLNSASAAFIRPLHLNLCGDRTEAKGINSASALGRRVGDDHALGDIRCLLTYRFAPPCASLSNEFSEVGVATPSIIFSP